MKIAIIKYNAGNLFSVDCALKRLGVEPVITNDKETLLSADKVIFPGVGEARTTMDYLKACHMDLLIKELKQPVLGICLGMQLLCRHSEEGDADCLGIFDAEVKRFQSTNPEEKVPHMGWNSLKIDPNSRLFKGIPDGSYVYFVHSYYLKAGSEDIVAATTEYGTHIHAAVEKGNLYACQFHPEKSSQTGLKILENFISLP